MDRKRVNPATRQFDEREIYRDFKSFKLGVINDPPATNIPIGGVHWVNNGIVFADRIEGRRGNTVWSAVIPIYKTIAGTYHTSSDPKYFQADSGTLITDEFVGYYLGSINGTSKITSVDTATRKLYGANGTNNLHVTINVTGQPYCVEWHDAAKKWFAQFGGKFYAAPYDMSAWTEIVNISGVRLQFAMSVFKPIGPNGIVFNAAGTFKVDFEKEIPICYKINTSVPTQKSTSDTASYSTTYIRRYLNSFSRLSGSTLSRSRTTLGIAVEHESATNKLNSKLIDYCEKHSAYAFGSAHPISMTLYPTSMDKHFTHYTLYATADCGVEGTGATATDGGNNPERYWWLNDIPVVKAFRCDFSGGASAIVTVDSVAAFADYDVGATLKAFSSKVVDDVRTANYADFVITGVTDATMIAATGSFVETGHDYDLTNVPCAIGASNCAVVSKSGTTVTATASPGDVFSSGDAGKVLYYEDGTTDIIIAYINTKSVTVAVSGTKVEQAVAWTPISRAYTDPLADDDLQVRDGFLLKQRYFQPMPNCNIGEVTPGFIFAAQAGSCKLYYCQTGEKSLIGYYHPGWHVDDVESPINILSAFPTKLVAYNSNGHIEWDLQSVQQMDSNSMAQMKVAPLGDLPISVVVNRQNIKGIGCLDRGSIQKTIDGVDILLTQNKELVTFDGFKFSVNFLAGRIMKKMQLLQSATATSYDKVGGFIVWGTEAASS